MKACIEDVYTRYLKTTASSDNGRDDRATGTDTFQYFYVYKHTKGICEEQSSKVYKATR